MTDFCPMDLPARYRAWELLGKGLPGLGHGGEPLLCDLVSPKADEVLFRVDAVCLCHNDLECVASGDELDRILADFELADPPPIPGFEAALTVVQPGSHWAGAYHPGARYLLHSEPPPGCDQDNLRRLQRGGLAEYFYAKRWMLEAEDECYLVPVRDELCFAAAALVGPWARIEACYHIPARTAPKPGGRLLLVFSDSLDIDLEGLYPAMRGPLVTGVLGDYIVDLTPVLAPVGTITRLSPTPERIAKMKWEVTEGKGFDDIVLIGDADRAVVRACDGALAMHGTLVMIGADTDVPVELDLAKVQYRATAHSGSDGRCVQEAYVANTREELNADGLFWIAGANGADVLFHVLRAVSLPNPPQRILLTGSNPEQMASFRQCLMPVAGRCGIDLEIWTGALSDLVPRIREWADEGVDDILLAGSDEETVKLVDELIAPGGVIHISSAYGKGVWRQFAMNLFTERHVRLVGKAPATMEAIATVMHRIYSGWPDLTLPVCAVGGMEAVPDGLRALDGEVLPGRTMIYPHRKNLPLTLLENLPSRCSAIKPVTCMVDRVVEQALLEES